MNIYNTIKEVVTVFGIGFCYFGILVALLWLGLNPFPKYLARKYNSHQLEKIRKFSPIVSILFSAIFLATFIAICIFTNAHTENAFIKSITFGAILLGSPIILILPKLSKSIIEISLNFKYINQILNYLTQNDAIYLKLKEQKPSDLFSRVSKPILEKLHWKLILVNKIHKKVALIVTNDSNEIIYREDFCFDPDSLDFIKDNFVFSI